MLAKRRANVAADAVRNLGWLAHRFCAFASILPACDDQRGSAQKNNSSRLAIWKTFPNFDRQEIGAPHWAKPRATADGFPVPDQPAIGTGTTKVFCKQRKSCVYMDIGSILLRQTLTNKKYGFTTRN
jgi:hypothetical protein